MMKIYKANEGYTLIIYKDNGVVKKWTVDADPMHNTATDLKEHFSKLASKYRFVRANFYDGRGDYIFTYGQHSMYDKQTNLIEGEMYLIYVLKKLFTDGIEMKVLRYDGGGTFREQWQLYTRFGKNWTLTYDHAKRIAEGRRKTRLTSLRTQIENINAVSFDYDGYTR